MTIPLTGTASLFERIGKNAFRTNSINAERGSVDLSGAGIVSLGSSVINIAAQYETTDQDLIAGLWTAQTQAQNVRTGEISYLAGLSSRLLVRMVDDDGPLTQANIETALPILIAQMKAASATVQANATTATVTAGGSNIGNPVVIASVIRSDGRLSEHVLPETIAVTCTQDSQSGSAAGSEVFSVLGEIAQTNLFAYNWPLGSGISKTLTLSDPAVAGVVTNGNFETWTVSNVPTGWTIAVGTAGTTVFKETSNVYRGTAALKILGNGSELTSVTQALTLAASSVYAVNGFIKMSAVPSAGVLAIDLYNGASVVQDAVGTNNSITKSLSAATTSYKPLSGFFRTPAIMPVAITLRAHLTTALDNTKSLYIDDLCVVQVPTQLYNGGPYVAGFPGSANTFRGDSVSIVTTNDAVTAGGKIQTYFWKAFNMPNLGLQLPSAVSSPTIPESVVG